MDDMFEYLSVTCDGVVTKLTPYNPLYYEFCLWLLFLL